MLLVGNVQDSTVSHGWLELRSLVLEGAHVRLEPLEPRHAAELFRAGADPAIWTYMPRPPLSSQDDARVYIADALRDAESGASMPFATVSRARGAVVGSTRYLDVRPRDRALEIGWTWLAADVQRTAINTECKYLLLRHAFEVLRAHRVQLKTDARNLRSQRAIERIGGVREGVLRRNRVLWDGHIRDDVYYSIIDAEWPAVKERLEQALRRSA